MSDFGVTASRIKAHSRLSCVMFCRDVCLQRRKQPFTMAEEFIYFHAAMQCKKIPPPPKKNIIYTVLCQTFKLLKKTLLSASSPISGYRNAEENEQRRKTRNQSQFGVFFQNRVGSIRYIDTQLYHFFVVFFLDVSRIYLEPGTVQSETTFM